MSGISINHYAEYAPKQGTAEHLVVLLHGLGADGEDLIGLAPYLAEQLPHAHFVAPNAPFACDMAPYGYQWFSLRQWTPAAMLKGANEALPVLRKFVQEQSEVCRIPLRQLALLGFSQGSMMSLHLGLGDDITCAAIVGFSGGWVGGNVATTAPVCLIHGEEDPVVPFTMMHQSAQALMAKNIAVETHARPELGHSIDPEGLRLAGTFLRKHLHLTKG